MSDHQWYAKGVRHIKTDRIFQDDVSTEKFLLENYPEDFEEVRQSRTTEYGDWETWTCGPDSWGQHKGPWKIADGYQEVEECMACGTQIGK